MLKKLYSNSGLILIAVLAAGVWFSNAQSYLADKNAPKTADFNAVVASPTPRKSAEEILGIAPSPSPKPSAVGVLEFGRQPQRLNATAICRDGAYSYSAN